MPAGRPTLYREEYAEQARRLCLLGLTDAELAEYFEISEATLNVWKDAHPEFMESISAGKLGADADVADKMYRRACGYSHDAVKIFMPAGAQAPVYAPYVEHYPPDTQAGSLWLRNRQPGKWRDRREVVDPNADQRSAEHLLLVAGLMRALTAGGVTLDGQALAVEAPKPQEGE